MAQNMGDDSTFIEFTMQSHDHVTHNVTTSLCSVRCVTMFGGYIKYSRRSKLKFSVSF